MKSLLVAILAFALFIPASGQKVISTASLQLSFPQGDYKATYPKTGVGFRWNVLWRAGKESPIRIGGEIGYLLLSTRSRYFDLFYLGFYDTYRITASSSIISLAFKARADLVQKPDAIQFFVDGTIGTNLFFSTADISRETYYGGSIYTGGSSSKGSWAFIFGPGAGIEIPLGERKEIALVFKGTYLFGSNTKYLTDPYIDNNGNVYFTERESKTDMIIAEAGVRFSMSGKR